MAETTSGFVLIDQNPAHVKRHSFYVREESIWLCAGLYLTALFKLYCLLPITGLANAIHYRNLTVSSLSDKPPFY